MGSFSDSVRNGWLTATVGGAAYSNAQVWAQVHLGDPGAAGTANQAVNTLRRPVSFGAVASGAVASNAAVTWVGVPATETYTHISLWSLAVGGAFLGRDDLAAPIAAVLGGNATIGAGDLTLAVT